MQLQPPRKYFGIIFIIIIVTGFSVYVYQKYFKLTEAERAKKELAAAISAVSKHMILPKDDQPMLAKVTDAKALVKQHPFFAGAINGDQLLLFPRSQKAILYSPSRDKIINVGPIQQSNQSNKNSLPQTATDEKNLVTVEVRNGTQTTGLGSRTAEKIRKLEGFKVIKVGDAKSAKTYEKTIIINSSKSDLIKEKVQTLIKTFGAKLQTDLPSDEPSSTADILVIIGEDSLLK